MTVKIKNLHPEKGSEGFISVRPGIIAMGNRPEYIESRADAKTHMIEFQAGIKEDYAADDGVEIIEHRQITYDLDVRGDGLDIVTGLSYSYNLFQLPDGRVIPYLWQNNAEITPAMEHLGEDDDEGIGASILDQ